MKRTTMLKVARSSKAVGKGLTPLVPFASLCIATGSLSVAFWVAHRSSQSAPPIVVVKTISPPIVADRSRKDLDALIDALRKSSSRSHTEKETVMLFPLGVGGLGDRFNFDSSLAGPPEKAVPKTTEKPSESRVSDTDLVYDASKEGSLTASDAILSLRKHTENPSQTPVSHGLGRLAGAGVFMAFPPVTKELIRSSGLNDKEQVAPPSTGRHEDDSLSFPEHPEYPGQTPMQQASWRRPVGAGLVAHNKVGFISSNLARIPQLFAS